jgi:hypothetical protein
VNASLLVDDDLRQRYRFVELRGRDHDRAPPTVIGRTGDPLDCIAIALEGADRFADIVIAMAEPLAKRARRHPEFDGPIAVAGNKGKPAAVVPWKDCWERQAQRASP